jgi:hypothetical protein
MHRAIKGLFGLGDIPKWLGISTTTRLEVAVFLVWMSVGDEPIFCLVEMWLGTETEEKKSATPSPSSSRPWPVSHRRLETSLARRRSPPRALPGPSAVASSSTSWPPAVASATFPRQHPRRPSMATASMATASDGDLSKEGAGSRGNGRGTCRRHVLCLPSSHPSSCRRRALDFASLAAAVYQRERVRKREIVQGPSCFLFFCLR